MHRNTLLTSKTNAIKRYSKRSLAIVAACLLIPSFINVATAKAEVAVTATAYLNVKVTGTVVDEQNQPLIGAAVHVKGNKTLGTITDLDGKFSLDIPEKSVLLVSYVGYITQELNINQQNSKSLSIVLKEDRKQLDEVVVVGYGTQKKETVTGSIASVKGEQLMKSPEANLTNSIVGRMPGIIARNVSGEPGNDYSEILIRGKATFGNTQPLFVIDGVANRWGNIDRLNPSDIESITILKDASAAIYGAQAANGVILVTTKRGQSSKPTITYDGSFSLSQNTRTPKLMNAYQYMVYDDEINAVDYPSDPSKQKFANIKGKYLDGTNDRRLYDDTDWMDVIFQRAAPKTQHSLSVSGGNDRVKYYLSGAFLYQEPGYRDTEFNFKTNQFRSNIDAKITQDLTVTLELSTREESRHESNYSTQDLFKEAFNAYPYIPDYYDNGLPGPGIAWGNNLAILAKGGTGYYKAKDFYVNSKVGFDLKMPWITKGLYFSGYAAFDRHFRNAKTQNGMWHTYQYNQQTGEYDDLYENSGNKTIDLFQQNNTQRMTTIVAKLGYERRFKNHNINAFIAYEQSKEEGEWFSAYRKDFYTQDIDQIFAGSDKDKTNDGSATISARQNYFGRISYGYKDRYLAEFTLRCDGSMNFPKDNRWGWFPGISIGWRITEEAFMDKVTFLDELKLKASVGQLGNDRVNPFQYLGNYAIQNGPQFGTEPQRYKGFTIGRVPNPNITWEVATTYNIGFESKFFGNRLSVDAQYFLSKRKNILTARNASIPSYTGLTLPDENLGKIQNEGMEAEIMYRDRKGDFTWFVGGNLTFARNKILFFDEAANIPDYQKRTGHAIDSYLLYVTDGLFQNQGQIDGTKAKWANTRPGDIKHVDLDGSDDLSSNDMKRFYESPTPEIVYGMSFGGTWKGVELSVLLQGQARAKAYISPVNYNRDVDYYNNRWISEMETPHAKYPRAFSKDDPINNLASDFWLKDAWFLRVKNIEVAYNLKKEWAHKCKLENVRIYASGSNLFTFDSIKLFDPECADTNGMYYPQQRTYNFGITVTL